MFKYKELLYGQNMTERITDAEFFEKDTHVNIPHEDAVEDAKGWVDENEL